MKSCLNRVSYALTCLHSLPAQRCPRDLAEVVVDVDMLDLVGHLIAVDQGSAIVVEVVEASRVVLGVAIPAVDCHNAWKEQKSANWLQDPLISIDVFF